MYKTGLHFLRGLPSNRYNKYKYSSGGHKLVNSQCFDDLWERVDSPTRAHRSSRNVEYQPFGEWL